MSESGGMPPPESHHTPHQAGPQTQKAHHHHHRRRRRLILCLAFTVLVLLVLAAAVAITLLAILRSRDPVTELVSVNATGFLPSVVTLPAVSIQLNITFRIVVRVRNPNRATFRHGPATTALYYRGAAVGYGEVPAGTVPSRGAATIRMNMTVQADRVVAAAGIGGLVADVLAGEMEYEARTEVPGTVRLLGFVKRSVEARSVCTVVIAVADVSVRRQECRNEAKL